MTDLELLIMGSAISFIALIGAYAFIRESFLSGKEAQTEAVRVDSGKNRPRRAA
jgi:hypothetical protein